RRPAAFPGPMPPRGRFLLDFAGRLTHIGGDGRSVPVVIYEEYFMSGDHHSRSPSGVFPG
ncbi:MAG: hypothetical protein LBR29_06600, partial [Methylobacteriaceae bacterium]|nr:hypothetical protein [Methylobacteriaceae bacterium]